VSLIGPDLACDLGLDGLKCVVVTKAGSSGTRRQTGELWRLSQLSETADRQGEESDIQQLHVRQCYEAHTRTAKGPAAAAVLCYSTGAPQQVTAGVTQHVTRKRFRKPCRQHQRVLRASKVTEVEVTSRACCWPGAFGALHFDLARSMLNSLS
jgi:hypothetical protein